MHRFAGNNARRLDLDAVHLDVGERPFAVDGIAESIKDAAQKSLTNRGLDDGTGALDSVAFLDSAVDSENDDTHVIGLQVERHALDAAGKFNHFTSLNVVQPMDAGDPIPNGEHLAHLGNIGVGIEVGDLLLEYGRDFCSLDVHQPIPFMASCRFCSLVRSELSSIRDPTRMIRPPTIDSSTVWLILMFRPMAFFRAVPRDVT